MANNKYTVMELEAIKKLCKCVNSVASLPADLIADTNVATNTTYSSYKIDAEMSALENDIQRYVDTALAGLNKLGKEVIDDKVLVVKENVLYLYKDPTSADNNYMQMMLINGVVVELGATEVDFSNIYSKTEVDDKFALKIDLDVLTTSFNNLVTSVEKKVDKDKIVTALDDTVTDEQVPSAKVVVDELNTKANDSEVVKKTSITTTINSTSTNTQVPSAKTINDKFEEANVYKGKYAGDLNDIPFIKSGVVYKYDIRSGDCTNTPVNTHGILHSTYFDSVNYCLQEFHSLQTNIASIYRRYKGAGVWSVWKELATMDKVDEELDKKIEGDNGVKIIEGKEINQTVIDTYGTEILKYPLGIWRISSDSIAKEFSDLPVKTCGRIEITSIKADTNANPWHDKYSYRVYNFETCDWSNYFRKAISGNTVGATHDTGWQKIATQKDLDELFQSVSSGKTLVANAITDKGVSTSTTATFATMASNISNITNYTKSEKQALATAITDKGVSTSSTDSFSTMASNISKITTTYKEETKSYNNTSSGTTRLVFTFSADVSGVKQITPPSNISPYIVPETSTSMFTVDGKKLTLYVNGTGTWEVTAFIKQ